MARPSLYLKHRDAVLRVVATRKTPTVRQIAKEVGVGVATAHIYLCQLADEGCVQWQHGVRGTLRCTPLGLAQAKAA